jgi:prepilin-type N-terminal cleavage/methylation domain-containing protein
MGARVRRLAAAQDGFTLPELLVVLAILGIVLAGMVQLFTGGLFAERDQTNRTQAQLDGRLALDKLRREIHCASSVAPTSGVFPSSSITITLGSWCSTTGGAAATVTWCATGAAQPYALWRYTGGSCSGSGTKWGSNLVDTATVTGGKIFGATRLPAPTLAAAASGTLQPGTYSYKVTAVLGGGAEVTGVTSSVTLSASQNAVNVSWSTYTGAASYNVYGRDGGAMHLLKNVTSGTSYVDNGPTSLTDNPLTLPSATINVASTSGFNAGANTIAVGASGAVSCTGTTSTSFTGCSGGHAGQYAKGAPVDNASSTQPPSATLVVTLPVDLTPVDAKQRFVLADAITLRNSRSF